VRFRLRGVFVRLAQTIRFRTRRLRPDRRKNFRSQLPMRGERPRWLKSGNCKSRFCKFWFSAGRQSYEEAIHHPLLLVLVVGLCAPAALAQAMGSVKGVAKDGRRKGDYRGPSRWFRSRDRPQVRTEDQQQGGVLLARYHSGQVQRQAAEDGKEIWHINKRQRRRRRSW